MNISRQLFAGIGSDQIDTVGDNKIIKGPRRKMRPDIHHYPPPRPPTASFPELSHFVSL